MTIEPFAQLHTAGTEDYELVRRELVRWSSATPLHARVRRRSDSDPRSFRSGHRCRGPVSPSETAIDLNRRGARIHSDADIRWLRGKDVVESPLLPGFSHAIADLLVSGI
jgi:hypothetical protein